jgi:hypothetical protein
MLFGLTAGTASAATSVHAEVANEAASLPIGLTGFASFVVVLGLIGLAVGLARLGRRSLAAKRAAAQAGQTARAARTAVVEEPVQTSA